MMFWIHLAIIFAFYGAPFLVRWPVVLIGVVLFYIQIFSLGNCVLTLAEFRGRDRDFHYYYLSKLGLRLNKSRVVFYTNYLAPLVILGTALMWQVVLRHSPLIW